MYQENQNAVHPIVLFSRVFLGVIAVFLLIACLVRAPVSLSSSEMKHSLREINFSNLFVYMLQSENHAIYSNKKEEDPLSFSKILFTLATNINPSNSITLLGREIPGLDIYNTEIAVAGKGTNLKTIPYDTLPDSSNEILKNGTNSGGNKTNNQQNNSTNNSNQTTPSQKNLKKVVYIYHTHSWESFLPLLNGVTNPNNATSTDNNVNVVAVGQRLTDDLINKGIGVDHDTSNMGQQLKQRNWGYANAYELSRQHVEEAMGSDKQLKYLIDIHRDSQRRGVTTTTINGKSYARIDIIIGQENQNYEANLSFAKGLNSELEKLYPGLSRGIFVKAKSEGNGIYNQDLSNRSILLEFGGVDNNMTELDNAVDAFSRAFSEYYWNGNGATSQ
ncbi:stage II sporulation protein P [Heyndrickxia acidicola]|uniref:Stage II sporulation protein P n=1 Tax=Heyndrickxia acidicola TaxID=209389 RepID=A0ABU6MJK4_9BACI|nr:stage II sporulation protein P [Heyndrickxia acidicola]MED1204494.1 stage II sporulation protein P [Heyndrickxia acidicola]